MPAQNLPALQKDASITQGELSNGISYYLVTNSTMKGVADFALVRKGMTDTLAARSELSGLPHFNKTVPHEFLSRKGIGCRPEGFITYGNDATIYRFDNVPMFDVAAADTTLLMLFDIIATQPRRHAVIVAGDIKPAEIMEKMKVFSLMVPSRNPSYQAPEYSWTPSEETKWAFEPSAISSVEVDFRSPRTPAAQMNTIQPFISNLFSVELAEVIKSRLKESLLSRDIPVTGFSVRHSGSADSAGDEHFVIGLEMPEDQLIPATMALSSTLAEIGSKGIGRDEYMTVRGSALQAFSKAPGNGDMVKMCISNYLFGSDLATNPTKARFFSSRNMSPEAEVGLFNRYSSALLGDTENATVSWTGSEEDYDEWIYQMMFKSTWNGVSLLDKPTYKWRVSARDTSEFGSDKSKTKLKSVATEPVSGGEIWTFANGMRVIYKKMASAGRFSYSMMVKGGFSSVRDLSRGEGAFFSDMMGLHRISGLHAGDFDRVLKANGVEMNTRVSAYDMRVSGSAPSSRYALVFKALLSVANDRKADRSIFDTWRKMELSLMEPAVMDSLMYPDNNYTEVKTPSGLTSSTLVDAESFFSKEFLRCGDGVIVLVGDLPSEALQKYLAKALGGFRVSKGSSPRQTYNMNLRSGTVSYSGKGDTDCIRIGLAASHPFSTESYMAFRIACLLLSRRLSGEMAGHGFHVDLSNRFLTYPQEVMEMVFSLAPVPEEGLPEGVFGGKGHVSEALIVARKTLTDILSAPVDAAALASCKSLLANEYSIALSDPSVYADAILMRYSSGKDVLTGYTDKINGVTAGNVKDVLGALAGGMIVEYVEGPEK